MNQKPFIPTTGSDYQTHMRRRTYIRAAITELKEDGTPLQEVIEVLRNELQLLTVELDESQPNDANPRRIGN